MRHDSGCEIAEDIAVRIMRMLGHDDVAIRWANNPTTLPITKYLPENHGE